MNSSSYQLLGLAYRAKKILTGETAMEAVKNKEAKLVVYASDASEKTKKRILEKCRFYEIDTIEVEDSVQISSAIGKVNCVMVAITDSGFAKKFVSDLK